MASLNDKLSNTLLKILPGGVAEVYNKFQLTIKMNQKMLKVN